MKAITYRRYGGPGVLTLAEVPKPSPRRDEVLIRILATTVTTADWRARSLSLPHGFRLMGRFVFGFLGPRQPILGTDLAGIVEAVGRDVSRFRPGDEVIAFTGGRYGCHAEFRAVKENGIIARKPGNLGFTEAAALPFGSLAALPFLRDRAGIKAGEQVLVVGASGAIGTAAVQIARHFGARVTAVTSTANSGLVASIGAARVIDYTVSDFTTTGETWDIILDTTGTVTFRSCGHVLRPGGRLVAVAGSLSQMLGIGSPPRASGKWVIAGVVAVKPHHLEEVAQLASVGALKPVIDRIYRLEQAAEAHALVDTGHKRGSVVLTLGAAAAQDPSSLAARPAGVPQVQSVLGAV